MQINSTEIKNILVVRNDRFGEFLLNIPAMRALKETFTAAKVTAVTDPDVQELAGSIPFIDEVISWSARQHRLKETLELVSRLRKKRFDIAVILNPTKQMHLITAFSGIPLRLGYDRKCGFLLTHRLKDTKYLRNKHEVEYNLELVGIIGAKTGNFSLSLTINNDIIKPITEAHSFSDKDRLVAIHPWTSDPLKQWPLGNFLELARRLAQDVQIKILIVGGKEAGQKSQQLFKELEDRVIDLTGKTSLPQLAAVLKICRLLISGDSGPVHLACAVDTPVLAIFRNDLPGKSASRWGPWGKNNSLVEKSSLEDIHVEEVLNKAKEILQGKWDARSRE